MVGSVGFGARILGPFIPSCAGLFFMCGQDFANSFQRSSSIRVGSRFPFTVLHRRQLTTTFFMPGGPPAASGTK